MQNLIDIKTRYRAHRDSYPEPFRLRIHRALSWLEKAQGDLPGGVPSENGLDMGFIALWIAFNAVYAKDTGFAELSGDRSSFRDFLNVICRLDAKKRLYGLVWQKFSGSIRLLLDNRYVFQPFWDFHNGKTEEAVWLEKFAAAKLRAHRALAEQDTETVLALVFDRLYTLRNQLIHGGATFNSSANRKQLRDACAFLNECVSVIIAVMMMHPEHDVWGKPFYPFVRED